MVAPNGTGQISKDRRGGKRSKSTLMQTGQEMRSQRNRHRLITRIDEFIIGMNAQLQETHTQSSGESEFYELGAGCSDGLYVKAILTDLGLRAKIHLRCDDKAAKALAKRQGFVQENTARESEVLVRARPRQSKCSRSPSSTDETLAKSQVGTPQEFDGKELRERDDVPSRPYESDENSDDVQHA